MQVAIYFFWICLAIIFYSYFGYGILLLVLTGIRQVFASSDSGKVLLTGSQEVFPDVTLVVAAYNEADILEAKIGNSLSLNYPTDKLSFLFITDGSDDGSVDIIGRHPQFRLLHESARRGKTAAINRAMTHVDTPITVFCDANTMLNRSAIRRIVRHYMDPFTGGVAGEKKIFTGSDAGTAATGEGLYWKYESLLKHLDAELYTVTGAAGELFSIRTSLWEPLPEDTILDDFVISTRINIRGYRIAYEPDAYASESPSASIGEEKKRKIRISAGAFQAMGLLKEIFNVFKHPVLFFQFFSHRILRWTLTPICFPALLVINIMLVVNGGSPFFKITFVAQMLFYGMALVGAYLKSNPRLMKISRICFYIVFMNWSIYMGFIRFLRGKQPVIWEKAGREIAFARH